MEKSGSPIEGLGVHGEGALLLPVGSFALPHGGEDVPGVVEIVLVQGCCVSMALSCSQVPAVASTSMSRPTEMWP